MIRFIKKEPVLSAAAVLAVITSFIIFPSKETLLSVDFRVLSILFCLMTITSGLDEEGVLTKAASFLLAKANGWRSVYLALVLLCFFSSMIVTNDVALIAFVPFAIKTIHMTGRNKSLIKVIVMQTIAANLGSMLTPIGNPQNLYLYSLAGVSTFEFIKDMSVMWVGSLIFILASAFTEKNEKMQEYDHEPFARMRKRNVTLYAVLFVVSILSVMHVFHYAVSFAIVCVAILIKNRRLFRKTDYSLLLTFIFFFVFIHNIKSMDYVRSFLEGIIAGNEFVAGFVLSQVISNVPAAILISGFTDKYMLLAAAVNLGGLGTLIASMASLISYKFYSCTVNANLKKFMIVFTKWNVIFVVLLIPFVYLTLNMI